MKKCKQNRGAVIADPAQCAGRSVQPPRRRGGYPWWESGRSRRGCGPAPSLGGPWHHWRHRPDRSPETDPDAAREQSDPARSGLRPCRSGAFRPLRHGPARQDRPAWPFPAPGGQAADRDRCSASSAPKRWFSSFQRGLPSCWSTRRPFPAPQE